MSKTIGRPVSGRPAAALAVLAALCLAAIAPAGSALAQGNMMYTPLTAKEKTTLLRMAREPVAAFLEGRRARDIRPAGRLNKSQRLVLSIYVDGKIIARAWELRSPGVLQATAVSLGRRILTSPDIGRPPTVDEWPRVKFGMAVIHQLKEAVNEDATVKGDALVALVDFTFAVGLPSDMGGGPYRNYDLYSRACENSGLRSTAWLGERATIYAGPVEEFFDK